MIVLSHPNFYYIKSHIKEKSLSKIEYNKFISRINGRSLSVCNSYYISSFINGSRDSK